MAQHREGHRGIKIRCHRHQTRCSASLPTPPLLFLYSIIQFRPDIITNGPAHDNTSVASACLRLSSCPGFVHVSLADRRIIVGINPLPIIKRNGHCRVINGYKIPLSTEARCRQPPMTSMLPIRASVIFMTFSNSTRNCANRRLPTPPMLNLQFEALTSTRSVETIPLFLPMEIWKAIQIHSGCHFPKSFK